MKVGDVVRLKSGGPVMTVQSVEDGRATCAWFHSVFKDRMESQEFAVESLTPVPSN